MVPSAFSVLVGMIHDPSSGSTPSTGSPRLVPTTLFSATNRVVSSIFGGLLAKSTCTVIMVDVLNLAKPPLRSSPSSTTRTTKDFNPAAKKSFVQQLPFFCLVLAGHVHPCCLNTPSGTTQSSKVLESINLSQFLQPYEFPAPSLDASRISALGPTLTAN